MKSEVITYGFYTLHLSISYFKGLTLTEFSKLCKSKVNGDPQERVFKLVGPYIT